jgi:hypothetical protein
MITIVLRVAPALMLALLVCGCAGSLVDNEKQVSLEYSSCKSASKTNLRSCDQFMETDVGSNNSSGYIEVGVNGGSTSRRTANSR